MIKFIVAQQHINLSRLIVVAFSAIGLASCGNKLSVKAAEVRSANKTFADWCRQKADLSPETKHTVDVLLEKAGTTDCVEGDRKLSSLATLDLSRNQIGDIKPLASLTNLKKLYLSFNKITDIKPLASLTNLTVLFLDKNQIVGIEPLASLTNLTVLSLPNNTIGDIKPLASLT
ncbi:MAG: leucine-rich repeat protein, partial [Microcoleus sp.]